jgi:hypothetical protein
MRTDNIKVTITIPIPYNKPDKNGNVYTEEAVENAVNHLHKNLPIIYRDNENEIDGKVIGTTTGDSHIATWDFENQVCKVTIDGAIFYGGTECLVNEIKDGKVTDFEIVGIGLSK